MTSKVVTLVCTVALLVFGAERLMAGEYHFGQDLVCYDCHTMHFSMQHGWDGSTTISNTPVPGGNWLSPTGPNEKLLKDDANDLCLSCHDGKTFAPDVLGPNTNTGVRQAGALTMGPAPYQNWKGHTLDVLAQAPGGGALLRLECVYCHSAHGNPNYRNLVDGTVAPAITYAKGTNDTTRDVFLRSWTLGDIETNYGVDNVDFNEPLKPAAQGSTISRFCKSCHTDFHGAAGDSNMGGAGGTMWLRHPAANADIGAQGGGHSRLSVFESKPYRLKVMSPSGDWGTQGTAWTGAPTDLTPNCLTCHKAHGNQNPFGLIYLAGTGPITEEGDADGNSSSNQGIRLRALCGQCHVQGN